MPVKILALKQDTDHETRAPFVPSAMRKLKKVDAEVRVESGIGQQAGAHDEAYREAEIEVVDAENLHAAIGEADVVISIHPPAEDRLEAMREGAVLVGMLSPLKNASLFHKMVEKKITAFSMEFIPRISRAQAMDVLSSQANLGGYEAVILAAEACPKIFPMMMTAAGTVAPARVFVLGAGVAGLQAIATAKRLGAVVEAFDVRSETKEQVQSLGARFIELPTAKQEGAAAGGYAKEQSEEERKQQQELMAKHVIQADAVITTAAVFGKAPPELIPQDVVDRMQAGSVVVDMAADPDAGRGNCAATRPGERYQTEQGATIIGTLNLPGLVPVHASQVYAANMANFLAEFVTAEGLKLELEDELQKGSLITHDGAIVHEMIKQRLEETNA